MNATVDFFRAIVTTVLVAVILLHLFDLPLKTLGIKDFPSITDLVIKYPFRLLNYVLTSLFPKLFEIFHGLFSAAGAFYGDFTKEVKCKKGCGKRLKTVGPFKCSGCGFQARKQHLFAPCPMCGKTKRFVNCPTRGCGTSIPRPGWWTQRQGKRSYS